jgi:hypothetical protein
MERCRLAKDAAAQLPCQYARQTIEQGCMLRPNIFIIAAGRLAVEDLTTSSRIELSETNGTQSSEHFQTYQRPSSASTLLSSRDPSGKDQAPVPYVKTNVQNKQANTATA